MNYYDDKKINHKINKVKYNYDIKKELEEINKKLKNFNDNKQNIKDPLYDDPIHRKKLLKILDIKEKIK